MLFGKQQLRLDDIQDFQYNLTACAIIAYPMTHKNIIICFNGERKRKVKHFGVIKLQESQQPNLLKFKNQHIRYEYQT